MTEPLFIHASGTPEARGRRYGALARERILKNLAFYADMFEKGWGVSWSKAAKLAESFVPHIEQHFPEGLLEMRGIAEGAGVAFEDILTLNCRSEILFAQPDGCSVFGVLPERSENGHTRRPGTGCGPRGTRPSSSGSTSRATRRFSWWWRPG